jgi:hypothetical protein
MDACVEIDALIEDAAKSFVITSKCHGLKTGISKYQNDVTKAEDMLATSYTHHLAGLLDSREFDIAREKFEQDKQLALLRLERAKSELAGYDLEK